MDIHLNQKVTSAVKVSWATVLNNGPLSKQNWSRKKEFPELAILCQNITEVGAEDPYTEVAIRRDDAEELREMRSWLDENARRAYTMHARFIWCHNGVAVQRKLDCLMFKFNDPNVAMFFKLRWYNAPATFH